MLVLVLQQNPRKISVKNSNFLVTGSIDVVACHELTIGAQPPPQKRAGTGTLAEANETAGARPARSPCVADFRFRILSRLWILIR
jgi:hypothetical protein